MRSTGNSTRRSPERLLRTQQSRCALSSSPIPMARRTRRPCVVRVDVGPGAHRTLLATASGDDAMPLRALEAGDRVVLPGRLAPLRTNGFDDRARWRHAVGRLDHVGCRARVSRRSARHREPARDRCRAGNRPLAPTPRALAAGFLLGDTRDSPGRDGRVPRLRTVASARGLGRERRVRDGVGRAVAAPFATRVADRGRARVIVVFAAMTRFEPSVLRASAMAAIALFAISRAGRFRRCVSSRTR